MRILKLLMLMCFFTVFYVVNAQNDSELAKGMNFIETKVYSVEDDARILSLYKDLRVADVSDGMDMVGLSGTGLVDPAIHADWVDLKDFRHVFRGIAVTH